MDKGKMGDGEDLTEIWANGLDNLNNVKEIEQVFIEGLPSVDLESVSRAFVLHRVAANGCMDLLAALHARLTFTTEDLEDGAMCAVAAAAWGGHLEVVQWLVDVLDLVKAADTEVIEMRDHRVLGSSKVLRMPVSRAAFNVYTAIDSACGGGCLPAARWLADRFGATGAAYNTGGDIYFAARSAYSAGRRDIVEWLVTRFGASAALDADLARQLRAELTLGEAQLGILEWLDAHFLQAAA